MGTNGALALAEQAATLTDRARELLADAEQERERLEESRQALIAEREAEVAKVRESYAVRIDAIHAEVALVDRLRKALDPEGAKAARKAAKAAAAPKESAAKKRGWRPRPDNFALVFRAMAEGAQTVGEISPKVPISDATVKVVLDWAREDGTVRLAGHVKNGNANARAYRLTPDGKAVLATTAPAGDDGSST